MNRFDRFCLIATCLLLAPVGASVAADYKIGVVNAPLVLEKSPQADLARKKLEKEFATRDRDLVAAQKDLKTSEDRLQKDGAIMSEARYAYIGSSHAQAKENAIDFLKACQVMKIVGDQDITGDLMLKVIAMVADQVEKRLEHLKEVEVCKAFDVTTLPYYGDHFKIVCEDPRLSLPFVCKRIKMINLKGKQPQPLTTAEFDILLSTCAASLNIEAAQPNGPAHKKIQNNFIWYDANFKSARDAIGRLRVTMSHVCRAPSSAAAPAAVEELEEV